MSKQRVRLGLTRAGFGASLLISSLVAKLPDTVPDDQGRNDWLFGTGMRSETGIVCSEKSLVTSQWLHKALRLYGRRCYKFYFCAVVGNKPRRTIYFSTSAIWFWSRLCRVTSDAPVLSSYYIHLEPYHYTICTEYTHEALAETRLHYLYQSEPGVLNLELDSRMDQYWYAGFQSCWCRHLILFWDSSATRRSDSSEPSTRVAVCEKTYRLFCLSNMGVTNLQDHQNKEWWKYLPYSCEWL